MEHEKDYIFIHIPRTCGRSIIKSLDIQTENHAFHKTIEDYVKEMGEETIRNIFKFTVIRNPFARAVALWQLYVYRLYIPFGGKPLINFDEWVAKKRNKEYINDEFDVDFYLDEMKYLTYNEEVLIDEFLRFETIAKDFKRIQERFQIPQETLPTRGKEEKPSSEEEHRKWIQYKIDKYVDLSKEDKKRIMDKLPKFITDYREAYESVDSIITVASENRTLIDRFGYTFNNGYPDSSTF